MKLKEDEARDFLKPLDLMKFAESAHKRGQLKHEHIGLAIEAYRNFLWLLWVNKSLMYSEPIVPTEFADKVWHEHILHTSEYRTMCDNFLGYFLDHDPSFTPGTDQFESAVEHTRRMDDEFGNPGLYAQELELLKRLTPEEMHAACRSCASCK